MDIENLMQLEHSCISGGDFNAHNTAWESIKTTTRGRKLKTFANITGLDIIAPPTPTRYGHHSVSFIALAVTKNFLYPYNITSVPELSSDHNPVILSFFFNLQRALTRDLSLPKQAPYHWTS
ncbi:hypothetical protein AVEN_192319-1 [Araneus ventricosus]|uniref:Endonuclease/exonuclease/phosphatase domain-containing protein n=1 Tax=Araneus ventricosus TaxID=182803 RepID=A0A4Y2A316_ARAVE|nr:hypothetical protein AVEN_192319-1 [Araneus ventricosus]